MPAMPPRIRLSAVTPAGATFSTPQTHGHRFFSITIARQARSKLDEETGEEIVIDLNKEARTKFKAWINGPGKNFKRPLYNEMNYISAYDRKGWQRLQGQRLQGTHNMPFPLNPNFRSHPVLSEEMKDRIHYLVMDRGRNIRSVSAELSVSLERVGAVVRLKEVEKEWIEKGKPIATYLTKALHGMLPVTRAAPPQTPQPFHESLQDMPSHPFAHRQIFLPVSESRVFTRADAGNEFGLPPAELAVPHPDLITLQKEKEQGLSPNERIEAQKLREDETQIRLDMKKRMAEKRNAATVVEHGRWAWRLKTATTGQVGFRYGVPHQDRKRGQIKIPTHVR